MSTNRQERQQELRRQIEDLVAQRGKLAGEAKTLETKRNEHADKLESLKQTHSVACRAEALGQPNEREKIERDIAVTSAKVSGTQTLITEKQLDIRKVDDQRAPLEQELSKLDTAEERDRLLAEVEKYFDEGKDQVRQIFELEKAHADRLAHLRSNYDSAGVEIRNAAAQAAERLRNARSGVRLFETFAPEQLKEMKAAKLVL